MNNIRGWWKLGWKELRRRKLWKIAVGEMVGSFLCTLLTSMAIARHDPANTTLHISLANGMSYVLTLFMFGKRGYFNPAIALALFITSPVAAKRPLLRTVVFMMGHIVGALLSQFLLRFCILPREFWFTPSSPLPSTDSNQHLSRLTLYEQFKTAPLCYT
eukprot:sb/3472876/